METKILRLQSGHNRTKAHLHRIGIIDSPLCSCNEEQTVTHVLFHCPVYNIQREVMIDNIERHYVRHNTPYEERSLTLNTLLWPSHTNVMTRREIQRAVGAFLVTTGADV